MALDPQTNAFTPRGDDLWRFQADMTRIQQTQAEHADRLNRLEKRHDESRVKSVWGASSPFPSILGGTPQQGPVNQPTADAFSEFDDQSNLIGSLHLDAEDEPRRMGATSRANSVRFDETANQGHWAHPSRTSIELLPRTGSSPGTLPMIERTFSHKSDGRQSSAGQSVHSAHSVTSGRANSLGADTTFSAIGTLPMEPAGVVPGLAFLGPVPTIIRCWLTTTFRHESLLYAAVCSGSCRSAIQASLIDDLDLSHKVRKDDSGNRMVKLSVYLPEATIRTSSSRPSSPTPQLPTLTVEFLVLSSSYTSTDHSFAERPKRGKSIPIILGSDVLHKHRADILFSSRTVMLFDDDHTKVFIPMVRPENSETFQQLMVMEMPVAVTGAVLQSNSQSGELMLEGLKQTQTGPENSSSERTKCFPLDTWMGGEQSCLIDSDTEPAAMQPTSQALATQKHLHTRPEEKALMEATKRQTTNHTTSSPSMWGTWTRGSSIKINQPNEWSKGDGISPRRAHGIKVLKPLRSNSRTMSSERPEQMSASSPGKISYHEDGDHRGLDPGSARSPGTRMDDGDADPSSSARGAVQAEKSRVPNPIGGASAFAWMHQS